MIITITSSLKKSSTIIFISVKATSWTPNWSTTRRPRCPTTSQASQPTLSPRSSSYPRTSRPTHSRRPSTPTKNNSELSTVADKRTVYEKGTKERVGGR